MPQPDIDTTREAFDHLHNNDFAPSHSPGTGWIQWKGTNVCMDVVCTCGTNVHMDAEFFYFYQCPACHKVFAVGQVVRLVELPAAIANVDPIVGNLDDAL